MPLVFPPHLAVCRSRDIRRPLSPFFVGVAHAFTSLPAGEYFKMSTRLPLFLPENDRPLLFSLGSPRGSQLVVRGAQRAPPFLLCRYQGGGAPLSGRKSPVLLTRDSTRKTIRFSFSSPGLIFATFRTPFHPLDGISGPPPLLLIGNRGAARLPVQARAPVPLPRTFFPSGEKFPWKIQLRNTNRRRSFPDRLLCLLTFARMTRRRTPLFRGMVRYRDFPPFFP